MQFVTNGRRKFVWLPRIDMEQYFDLEQDPDECCNLIDDPDRQDEINQWRSYLVDELKARDCGWVKDDQPWCPNGEPLVSPYKKVRWQGE